ncbi:MAG: class I SAM-dependent methyltransferase [Chloroflexi bacterium]|nr:class I SAM-dependent methyltransferase [Chloroflexota bacterium]
MALVYHADRRIAAMVLAKLKDDGGVAPAAQLADGFYQRLRKEVLPRDLDFLHMFGRRPIGTKGPCVENDMPLEHELIEIALQRLKRNGFVAEDAYFSAEATHQLAQEVGYRDFHFLYYLGLYAEHEIGAGVLELLKQKGIIASSAAYSSEAFERLRQEVKAHFEIPDTAMSPVMERLLYLLSSVKQPRRTIGIGIFCGNTLVWNAGASCNGGKVYEAENVYGIDIDAQAICLAKQNFGRLTDVDHVEFIAEDGRLAADRLAGPFDYIYLDADSEVNGKGIYLELLQRLYPKLSPGGWVVAHDTTLPAFRHQLDDYLHFVRDRRNFTESICLDVDIFGLELSIK